MNQRQRKKKKDRVKAHYNEYRVYNNEHKDEIEKRRNVQKKEAEIRQKKREKIKAKKEKREAKRKARNGKSPNLREINMWGIKVPIYVTQEKLKMFRKGDKDGKS